MRCLLALTLLLAASPLTAQDNSPLFPTFSITGGGYSGAIDTEIRLDPETTGAPPGTRINLERDLGLETTDDIYRFGAQWRPFRRHQLDASYFSATRSGFRDIDEEIVFGETSFPVRATVTTEMAIDFIDLDYTYWLRQTERSGFGLTLGVSAMSIDAAIRAERPGEDVITLQEEATTDVPVPVVGFQGRYAFTRRILGEVRAAMLPNVNVEDIRAQALTGGARIEYRIVDAIGIGAGYNYFNIDGDLERNGFRGELEMTVSGFEAYVRIALGTR